MIQVERIRSSPLERWRRIAGRARAAASYPGSHPFAVLGRLLETWRRTGLRPGEALQLGIANAPLAGEALSALLPKGRLQAIQDTLNPRDWACLTEDKSIFYPYCDALGIAVPKTHAVVRPEGGWAGGQPLVGRDAWVRTIGEMLPDRFVTKPALGVYGERVRVWTRRGGGFADQDGRVLSASELHEELVSDPKYRCFVVQERLEDHPALTALTGSRFLQTVRVATLIDGGGSALPLYAEWKLIVGGNAVDNFMQGTTGNMIANVALETGLLSAARRASPDGVGSIAVPVHPLTGRALEGAPLPGWQDVLELVRRAALLFRPLRTVGWDVALTARGPVIVEGNRWWDPANDAILGPPAPGVACHELVRGVALLVGEYEAARRSRRTPLLRLWPRR